MGERGPGGRLTGAIVRGGLLVWMSSGFLCSQPTFEHVVAAPDYQYAEAVRQVGDSGYLVAGTSHSAQSNRSDGYVTRLDSLGQEVWARTIGGPTSNWVADLEVVPGGFVVLGSRISELTGRGEATLAALDDDGDERWSRTLPAGSGRDYQVFDDLAPAPGGGWMAAGRSGLYSELTTNLVVARLDDDGEVVWSHELGASTGVGEARIGPTDAGGWIVASPESPNVVIRRLDASGNETWRTTIHPAGSYSYPLAAQLSGMTTTPDGGVAVAWTASYSNLQFATLTGETQLAKVDMTTGGIVWSRTSPLAIGTAADYVWTVRATADGGLVTAGYNSYVIGCGYGFSLCEVSVGLVTRMDSSGAWLWRREIGTSSQHLYLVDAWETFDQGVVAVGHGYFSSDSTRHTDLYVVRTDSAGGIAPPS